MKMNKKNKVQNTRSIKFYKKKKNQRNKNDLWLPDYLSEVSGTLLDM